MRKFTQKEYKTLAIIACILLGISIIYGFVFLPHSVLFIISEIVAIFLLIYIIKFPFFSDEIDELKEKLLTTIKKQENEYKEQQEKMKQEYDEHLQKMKDEHEAYEKAKQEDILKMQQVHEDYEKSKADDYEKYLKFRNEKLSQLDIDVNNELLKKQNDLQILEDQIQKARCEKDTLELKFEEELAAQKEILEKIKDEIAVALSEMIMDKYDYSEYKGITSEECKNRLTIIKIKEQELYSNMTKSIPDDQWIPVLERHKKINNLKELIRCYNAECSSIISNITFQNIDAQREKLAKVHKSLNKLNECNEISLPAELLELKLEELNVCYTYELKKQQEAEEQREIRQQMLEEEKVRREIEYEKLRIEKEEVQFKNEINKLMSYMSKSTNDTEKELYIAKIKELEEKLSKLTKDKENVFQREQNTRAGFVYIISNIGSFGEDIYKIGMTRRLIPMDRIKELSSASVPFPFDVHAMIFSEDAPALETLLHNKFKDFQVNKVNDKKEFFKIDLNEIKNVVLSEHNKTVKFTMIAEAEEYRKTLDMQASEKQKQSHPQKYSKDLIL